MQIATLNYQYKPKENVNGDSRAKLCQRHILTTITSSQKKVKQRQSLNSDWTIHSNGQLPPIIKNRPRRSSIRINGSSVPSSKLGEPSAHSFQRQSRSNSRQSNKSENFDLRNRSTSRTEIIRPTSKLNRLKFGYPIKLRSAEFYGPSKSEEELHLREDSFVNDSIRSSHQTHHSSIIRPYEALADPHLRRFFQSPIVLDIVRKTLNVDPNTSFKQDGRSSKMSKNKRRSASIDLYENRNDDYHRIVSKGSSGYAKLNGYDCLPSYSPARRHFNANELITSSSQRWNTTESRLNHSMTYDKNQTSANTSTTSFPITNNSNEFEKQQKKKKTRKSEKSKQLKSIPKSSSSTLTKNNDNASEQKK